MTLLQSFTANTNIDALGWYAVDPSHPNTAPVATDRHLLVGPYVTTGQTAVSFQRTPYCGLFLHSPSGGYYSQAYFNDGSDPAQHFAVFHQTAGDYVVGAEESRGSGNWTGSHFELQVISGSDGAFWPWLVVVPDGSTKVLNTTFKGLTINSVRMAYFRNELQLDYTLTRTATFYETVTTTAMTATQFSSPWPAVSALWSGQMAVMGTTPSNFAVYPGLYGSSTQACGPGTITIPVRASYPSGATAITSVTTSFRLPDRDTDYGLVLNWNGSQFDLQLYYFGGSTFAFWPLPVIPPDGSVRTFNATLGGVTLNSVRFARVGNELQVDYTLTRAANPSGMYYYIIGSAITTTDYSVPWPATLGTWSAN